jgi:hypothetical protein
MKYFVKDEGKLFLPLFITTLGVIRNCCLTLFSLKPGVCLMLSATCLFVYGVFLYMYVYLFVHVIYKAGDMVLFILLR